MSPWSSCVDETRLADKMTRLPARRSARSMVRHACRLLCSSAAVSVRCVIRGGMGRARLAPARIGPLIRTLRRAGQTS